MMLFKVSAMISFLVQSTVRCVCLRHTDGGMYRPIAGKLLILSPIFNSLSQGLSYYDIILL